MVERGPAGKSNRGIAELVQSAASAWKVPVSRPTEEALGAYGTLLLDWGSRINITGVKSITELVAEHFPDAFALASRLGAGEPRIIDVGSGGGLPAVPLALLVPSVHVTMFEPIAKKAAFLRTAVRELGLGQRVRVEARRVDRPPAEDDFDVAVSRATFPPAEWLALARGLVRPGGRVFALTSHRLEACPPELAIVQAIPYLQNRRWLMELVRST